MKSSTRETWLLLVVSILFTTVLMGDPRVRMATSIADDHPATTAHFFSHPAQVGCVNLLECKSTYMLASLPNWLATGLYLLVGFPPELLSIFYVFLQNVLLIFAFRAFIQTFSKNDDAFWIVPLFVYAAHPWAWNLAFYPSMMHTSYPGHLVMPFLLFAATAFVSQKFRHAYAWLAVSALIHPTLTLHFLFILSLFLLLEKQAFRKKLRAWWPLAGVGVICVMPAMVIYGLSSNLLTTAEVIPALLANDHAVPWRTASFWSWALPTFAGSLTMAIYLVSKTKLNPRVVHLFRCSVLGCAFLGCLHVLGYWLQIPALIRLCPLRATVLLLILMVPISFTLLFERLGDPLWVVRVSAASLILFPASFVRGFFWAPLVSLISSEWARKQRPMAANLLKAAGLLTVTWMALFLLSGRPARSLGIQGLGDMVRQAFMPGGATITLGTLFFAFAAVFFLSAKPAQYRLAFLIVLPLLFYPAYNKGLYTWQGEARDRYHAQKWVAENTLTTDIILTPQIDFLGVAQRRYVALFSKPFSYDPYIGFRKSKVDSDAREAFFAQVGKKTFEDFNEANVLLASRTFGGEYALRSVKNPLNFPEVYRNGSYILYRVKP